MVKHYSNNVKWRAVQLWAQGEKLIDIPNILNVGVGVDTINKWKAKDEPCDWDKLKQETTERLQGIVGGNILQFKKRELNALHLIQVKALQRISEGDEKPNTQHLLDALKRERVLYGLPVDVQKIENDISIKEVDIDNRIKRAIEMLQTKPIKK